jgi:hypothetical protein
MIGLFPCDSIRLHENRPSGRTPESSTPASMRECYVEIVLACPHTSFARPHGAIRSTAGSLSLKR